MLSRSDNSAPLPPKLYPVCKGSDTGEVVCAEQKGEGVSLSCLGSVEQSAFRQMVSPLKACKTSAWDRYSPVRSVIDEDQ